MTETHEQLRERHRRWIELNGQAYAADAPRAYAESGRGAYIITATGPPRMVPIDYSSEPPELPAQDPEMAQMIRSYDPATEFVVIILEPDDFGVHAYRVGITGISQINPN